jgi:uncharacterized membrane protein
MTTRILQRLRRAVRHGFSTHARLRRAFPQATLGAIEAAIAAGEAGHLAELRVALEAGLPLASAWHGQTCRQRALQLFAQYHVWDTEQNCGVLVYVNLAERKVEIIADRGIDRAVTRQEWQAVCRLMTAGFASGQFHEAILAALAELNRMLQQHFPGSGPRPNQLPNQPIML